MQDVEIAPEHSLLTLGQIAERLDVPMHRVKYALATHRIEPATRVGILRCWRASDLDVIQAAVSKVASNRRGLR